MELLKYLRVQWDRAGAVVAAVLGLVALSKRSTYHAANTDPARVADRASLRDDAAGAERNATIAAIVTGVAAGATLALVLTRPTVASRVTVGASPIVPGGRGGAFVFAGRF